MVTFVSLQSQAAETGGLPSNKQVKMASKPPRWPLDIRRTKKLSITGGSGFRRGKRFIGTILEIKKKGKCEGFLKFNKRMAEK